MARRPIPDSFFAEVEGRFPAQPVEAEPAPDEAPLAPVARPVAEILDEMYLGWLEARDPQGGHDRWALGPDVTPPGLPGALPSMRRGGPLFAAGWARFLAEQPDAARLAQQL
jgi:hypothetical protein